MFYSELLSDWVVFHLDAASQSYVIPTQVIRLTSDDPELLTQKPLAKHKSELEMINAAVSSGAFMTDIRTTLPEGFSPRLLFDQEKVIFIAQNENDARLSFDGLTKLQMLASDSKISELGNSGGEQYHFRWSRANWTRFCAKSAFEALCLFEGADKCLSPTFETVRNFVINGPLQSGREMVFNKNGPLREQDVPIVNLVDLTVAQNAPETIDAIVPGAEAGMHVIIVYEINGWILAGVVFAGFPPTILVLGGPGEHLADIYQLIYDDKEAGYDFVKLAYDKSKPIIPLNIPGARFNVIAESYHLKSVPS
jgi:hypothetical protein